MQTTKILIDVQGQVIQMTTSLSKLIAGSLVDNIASEVGISIWSIHTIISEHLGFRKIRAKWVPRLLTKNKKTTGQVGDRENLLNCSGNFLRAIVTCDKQESITTLENQKWRIRSSDKKG